MKTFIHLFSILFISLFFSFSVFGQISVKEEMKIVQREFYKAKNEKIKVDSSFVDSTKVTLVKIKIEKEKEDIIFCGADISPAIFEGGMDNFYKISIENLRFPKEGKVGRAFLRFVVDTTGKMTDFEIMKSVSEENSNEVLRVMKFINENYSWGVAMVRGKKVTITFAIPIVFILDKKKK